VVKGRVQGVGFRWWSVREARRRGIVGTVRNRGDGSVEIEATGDEASVAGFAAALEHGPPTARVDAVEMEVVTPSGSVEFRVLR